MRDLIQAVWSCRYLILAVLAAVWLALILCDALNPSNNSGV